MECVPYKLFNTSEISLLKKHLSDLIEEWSAGWIQDECIGLNIKNYFSESDGLGFNLSKDWFRVSASPVEAYLSALFRSKNNISIENPIIKEIFQSSLLGLYESILPILNKQFSSIEVEGNNIFKKGMGWISVVYITKTYEMNIIIRPDISPNHFKEIKKLEPILPLLQNEMTNLSVYMDGAELLAEDLYQLQIGDVLPLRQKAADPLQLRSTDNKLVSRGYLGKSGDMLALSLEKSA